MKFIKNHLLLNTLSLVLVIFVAIFFRTNQLEGKMTFEWDQARDFTAVETMLKTGKPMLLGPIVRGDSGGFYLGPLYYYLITPLYYFSGGNPLSLSVVPIGMDVLVICILYFFLRSKTSWSVAFITGMIWAGSPLLIRDSYTPWNVSLISVWMILFIINLLKLSETSRFRYKFILVFLSSLTTNLHLSLLPIAALFLGINYRSFLKLSIKQYMYLVIAAIAPISTLIAHDLTHSFENTILLKRFLFGVSTKSANFKQIASLIIEKYGYTIGRLYTGEPYTLLGWVITLGASMYGIILRKDNIIIRSCLYSILAVLISLAIYRDADFAEYYFLPAFIPLMILVAYLLRGIGARLPRIIQYGAIIGLTITYLYLGWGVRMSSGSPYSLSVKKLVIESIKELDYPVEIRTNLPRERNTGFTYLMKQAGLTSDVAAQRKAYIYEVKNLEVVSPPEARSVILEKPIQAFKLIVFSN